MTNGKGISTTREKLRNKTNNIKSDSNNKSKVRITGKHVNLVKVYLLTNKKSNIRVVTNSVRQVWAWLYGTTPSNHPKKYSTLLYTIQGRRDNEIEGWTIKPFMVKDVSLKALGLTNHNSKHWRFTKGDTIVEVINKNSFLGHIYGFNKNGTAKKATTFRNIAKGRSKTSVDGWKVELVK